MSGFTHEVEEQLSGGGEGADTLTGTLAQRIKALVVVAIMASIGGVIVQILMKGVVF